MYYADRYLDMSDMRYEFLPNGSVYVHGSEVFIRDLSTEHLGEVF